MPQTDVDYNNKKVLEEGKKEAESKAESGTDRDADSLKDKINLESLKEQVQKEYDLAWKHQKPKKDEWNIRLKMFNNQKRDKESVGDTTMFTIFQTVFASLYNDQLMVDFRGREDGDEETANNLTSMAKADYDDMEKDITDYDWNWDTLFFGRGLLLVEEFIRDPDNNIFYPVPEVIDPVVWLRDPAAKSVNGNKQHKGAMRFGGCEIKMTKDEIEDHSSFFSDIKFDTLKFGSGTYSLLHDAIEARDMAQGNNSVNKDTEANLGDNAQYDITQWFTRTMIDGKLRKIKVWLANDRSMIIGLKVFKRDYWPIFDRPLYPTAHDWDGTSIPDLTEDKQRARAVAQNLGIKAMKADLYPMYVYDTNKVKNRNDLNFDFNKFVAIDAKEGEPVTNAIAPLIKAGPNMGLLQFIYESLDASAQKATATPDIKMGIQSNKDRPLGETNLQASNADTRYSLGAKLFGWSEKRFWQHWYNMYKDYFAEDIDEKVVRVVGAFGSKWRPLTKKDITCNLDPDVYIESTAVSRAKDLEDRLALTSFFQIALAEPTANRRWGLKKLAKLNGLQKDEVDRLFPPTVDERIAEEQNQLLNKNELVPVLPEDDHNVHLEIHSMAKDTPAAKAHIKTHQKALSIKKVNPEFFPEDQSETNMNQPENMPAKPMAGDVLKMKPITPSQTSNQL